MNSNEFLLDSGFWGFLYKILTPVEWLQTWIMKIVHDFFVMLGVSPIGVSWVLAIIILVLVVQACIFPLFYKQMKSMRKMQALAPKMQRIQNKYKGKTDQASKEAMSRETMKLYQDNDANPAGSCLPMPVSYTHLVGSRSGPTAASTTRGRRPPNFAISLPALSISA